MMHLFVTGGCGFIGANFIRRILRRHSDWKVLNLDKLTYAGNPDNLSGLPEDQAARYAFVQGDIGDRELAERLFDAHGIDAVVNFAAESHVDRSIHDPAPFFQTNVMGTQALLEAARSRKIGRFVHISTDEVYGTLGPEGKFVETTPLAPNSPYSASKAASDMLCRAYFETYGFPVLITRCSNNYGPYQFPEKLIPLMYLRASADEPLPVYGDGLNVRDWIHVEDHCKGVELALLKGKEGHVYNFGSDGEKNNLEVVTTILDILGKPHSLINFVKDRPGHDRRYAMGYGYAQKELGFAPEYEFSGGIRATLDWYGNNAEWLGRVQDGSYRTFMDSWYKER